MNTLLKENNKIFDVIFDREAHTVTVQYQTDREHCLMQQKHPPVRQTDVFPLPHSPLIIIASNLQIKAGLTQSILLLFKIIDLEQRKKISPFKRFSISYSFNFDS